MTAFPEPSTGIDDAIVGSQAVTSFDFYGIVDSYTVVDLSPTISNDFKFSNGNLVFYDFDSDFFNIGSNGSGFLTSLVFLSGTNSLLNYSVEFSPWNGVYVDAGSLTPNFTIRPVAAVPLPTGAVLLLSGLLGVAGLKCRKKNSA